MNLMYNIYSMWKKYLLQAAFLNYLKIDIFKKKFDITYLIMYQNIYRNLN